MWLKNRKIRVVIVGGLAILGGATLFPQKKHSRLLITEDQVVASMPAGARSTSWRIKWSANDRTGLVIEEAWFHKATEQPPLKILNRTGLSNIFVPYASGSPRLWDLSAGNQGDGLNPVSAEHVGPDGKILSDPSGRPVAVVEFQDRGVAWRDDSRLVRGHQVVLWSTIKCSNYHYIIQYTFRDDGVIQLGLGATGRNLYNQPNELHMHNALWRIEPALSTADESICQNAVVMSRQEPAQSPVNPDLPIKYQATLKMSEFNDNIEGSLRWQADEFTMLNIESKLKNRLGMPVGYDVMIARTGLARHHGSGETALLSDYFVTPYDPRQTAYNDLPAYVAGRRSIKDARLVLWCSTSMQHEPRAEDGIYHLSQDRQWQGATLTMWSGIELRPRNLFESTPLY